jgi:hypothetical protein
VTNKRAGGDHYSQKDFRLPIGRWSFDDQFENGSHTHALHFAPVADAKAGKLNSYGSHLLVTLPSVNLWGDENWSGHCWHDAATAPLTCLTCEANNDLEVLSKEEFWREIGIARAMPDQVVLPNGAGLLKHPAMNSPHLLQRELVLPPTSQST